MTEPSGQRTTDLSVSAELDDIEDTCEHPTAAVISDVNGYHFCARCDAQWWEDPL